MPNRTKATSLLAKLRPHSASPAFSDSAIKGSLPEKHFIIYSMAMLHDDY